MSKIEKVFIEERKVVKDKDDILKLGKKELKEVSEKLKDKEGVFLLEKDSNSQSKEETPLSIPHESPIPKDINKNKNVYEFNENEQKAFSLSDLKQLKQFFIQNEIKN
ncbi:2960_t:CDS:2, partial [Funneliformis mosseae]